MEVIAFIAFIVIGGLVWVLVAFMGEAKNNRLRLDEIEGTLKEEGYSTFYRLPVDGSRIGFDFEKKKVAVIDLNRQSHFRFRDIISVEIIQNGGAITKTDRGSQIAGAAVGGMVAGGLGFLAGALTGAQRSTERVTGLAIKIIVDDADEPVHRLKLFEAFDDAGDDFDLEEAVECADRIHANLLRAMRAGTSASRRKRST